MTETHETHARVARTTPPASPPPVTGAWREGDPPGRRRFLDVGPLVLESGRVLPAVRIAYETWGTLSADASNAVLVLHALTGDSHVAGPGGNGHPAPGWWDRLVGPGKAIDTDRFFVVCPNALGGCQGSTGPSSIALDGQPWGSRFPFVTVRDQVTAEVRLADALRIPRWAAVIGGSLGGMRALEWAVGAPDRVAALIAVAVGAAATADQIGLCSAQLHAIRADPGFRGGDYYEQPPGRGPHAGLGVARRVAQLTYRSAAELQARFGRDEQGDGTGRYAVESYLDHHAAKLARRFDANSYVVLTEAMNAHDVGRGRGGVAAALGRFGGHATVVGVDSDRLYPLELQRELVRHLPTAGPVTVVNSPYGHDGFLIEAAAMGTVVAQALHTATRPPLAVSA